jgi:protein ImuB
MSADLSNGGTAVRILSLYLPRFSTDRLIRLRQREETFQRQASAAPREKSSGKAPLAVVSKIKNAMRVVAVDENAERRGIRLGVSLADARGAVPDLCVEEADEAADRALLEKLADWCDRYTPLVALDPPQGLFLDISGCAHLFARSADDGEEKLLTDCIRRLATQGFEVHGAIASSAGAAWALAHYGETRCIPAGDEVEALADLPVAALRIGPEQNALLDRLGLKRVGQLIGKPRAPFAARFGIELVTRLDQALGHLDEVLSPRKPAPSLSAERRFSEPVVDYDSLLQTVASLAKNLVPTLERNGLGARLLEAAFFRIDGEVVRVEVGTAAPLRAPDAMSLLFSERLSALESEWDAGFGFDMVRLAVLRSEALSATQIDLAGEEGTTADLTHLYDRLGARLGPARITRYLPVDTHIPERAVVASPVAQSAALESSDFEPKQTVTSPLRGGRNLTGEARQISGGGSAHDHYPHPKFASASRSANFDLPARGRLGANLELQEPEIEAPPERPLRLFARPEQVEVIAEVPEGPPLRFRWRRVTHHVARAEGPERIAPEWWREMDRDRSTRDYFRVEDAEGRRYWLFREGLYGRETSSPVWYMHGLFA